ncbi:MAG: HAD-IA family hydrolase [Pseudomonadales bacterium]
MNLRCDPAGLIFDLDGTLLDTEPLYSAASQKVLDEYGETYTPELKRRVMGGDSHTSAQIVIDEFALPLTSDEYLKKREVHLVELFATCPEIKGAGDFINALAESGIPFGLATSSHRHLRDIKLCNKAWGEHFHATVCGDHPGLKHGKPAPDIFLLCAAELDVAPDQCIAFEDSRNGIAAARAANMQVVGLNSPYVEDTDLSDATLIVDSFEALYPFLDTWQRTQRQRR